VNRPQAVYVRRRLMIAQPVVRLLKHLPKPCRIDDVEGMVVTGFKVIKIDPSEPDIKVRHMAEALSHKTPSP